MPSIDTDFLREGAHDLLVATPGSILRVLLVIAIALLMRFVAHRLINRIAKRAGEGRTTVLGSNRAAEFLNDLRPGNRARRKQRADTIASLVKSVASGIIFVTAFVMILDVIGLPVGPLIAGAGLLGAALGFGAQNLVRDFLSGVFMILEDQFGVGDFIDLGEATGDVEEVGLRVTRLRDVNGTVWYVRNGEVLRVGNQSQNWSRSVLDITVDYSSDLSQVKRVLLDAALAVRHDPEFAALILADPEVWGVQSFDKDGVVVRLVVKTAPAQQWAIGRAMRSRIKDDFDAAGIQIPTSFLNPGGAE